MNIFEYNFNNNMEAVKMQLFSIIVPVYNVEEYLEDCLNSIINQTYKNLEIILIDDGSTDNSGKICDIYAKFDNRIIVVHKENGGVSSARNYGLKLANGDYIVWIDSDDYIEKNALMRINEEILRLHADIVFFNYNIVEKNKIKPVKLLKINCSIISKADVFMHLAEECNMPSFLCNKVIKKELYANIVFNENVQMLEDYAIMPYLLNKASKIVYLSECFYNYRQINSSITHNVNSKIIKRNIKIANNKQLYILDNFPELKPSINTGKAYIAMNMLQICFENKYNVLFRYFSKILINNIVYFLFNKRVKSKCKIKALLMLKYKYYILTKNLVKMISR